jgi:uncharacterized membrane protein
MKICPICNQTYTDDNLNFCLNDGGVLATREDDAPPTLIMDQARTTNPAWTGYQPPTYENQQLTNNQNWGMQGQNQLPTRGKDQTLPTVSLILGILGLVLFCCYGGIPFGLVAVILGYLGMQNANNNPTQYGGREMAIAGMVIGGLVLVISILFIFLGILGSIF